MTIRAAGVGSGIDVESIITQLMELEREPLNRLDTQRQELSVQISTLGTFKGVLSELETQATRLSDTSIFGKYSATSTDEDILTVDVAAGTEPVDHDIEVLSLATSHQLATALYVDGEDSAYAAGSYNFSSGDESFQVDLPGGSTLLNMRDAINDHVDNTSIRASILNLDGGSRLILSSIEPGAANAITAPGDFTEFTAAQDAQFTVDGFAASSSTNEVTDVIPGITLSLQDIGTASINTARDNDSVKEQLELFVTSYNDVLDRVDSLLLNEFPSDSTIRGIASELSREFFQSVDVKGTEYSFLDLGLTFDRDGNLSIDDSKFEALQSSDNYADILEATTLAETGLAYNIKNTIERYTDAEGLIELKKDALQNNTDALDTQSSRLEYQLEQTEDRYRRQFSAMDTVVAQLQSSSSFLIDQLNNLPTYNNQ
jgi:flagellar hook-associated protein 2